MFQTLCKGQACQQDGFDKWYKTNPPWPLPDSMRGAPDRVETAAFATGEVATSPDAVLLGDVFFSGLKHEKHFTVRIPQCMCLSTEPPPPCAHHEISNPSAPYNPEDSLHMQWHHGRGVLLPCCTILVTDCHRTHLARRMRSLWMGCDQVGGALSPCLLWRSMCSAKNRISLGFRPQLSSKIRTPAPLKISILWNALDVNAFHHSLNFLICWPHGWYSTRGNGLLTVCVPVVGIVERKRAPYVICHFNYVASSRCFIESVVTC